MTRSTTALSIVLILLFVALGALALLFLQYRTAREEVAFLLDRIAQMEERRNAAYPCWVRPDGVIPEIAGVLVIHGPEASELRRTNGGSVWIRRPADGGSAAGEPWNRGDALFSATRRLFQQDNQFASRNRCYIRIRVENLTNDYGLYLETAQVLKSLGIVAVNE